MADNYMPYHAERAENFIRSAEAHEVTTETSAVVLSNLAIAHAMLDVADAIRTTAPEMCEHGQRGWCGVCFHNSLNQIVGR